MLQIDLSELWRFREVLYYLVWRDIKVRYKQTFLGASWALLKPVISMVVLTVIFGHLVGIEPGSGIPYPLFVFAGLLAWLYFSSALAAGSGSVLNNGGLVTKAYFPRLYLAFAAVVAPLVDFILSLIVLVGMFAWYGRMVALSIFLLPIFVLLALVIALGTSLFLAAITVRYRDVPFMLPFGLQLWMYATPIIYPLSVVPGEWRWVFALNPLTGVVEGFRWSLLGVDPPSGTEVSASIVIALALTLCGLLFFRRAEPRFADVI